MRHAGPKRALTVALVTHVLALYLGYLGRDYLARASFIQIIASATHEPTQAHVSGPHVECTTVTPRPSAAAFAVPLLVDVARATGIYTDKYNSPKHSRHPIAAATTMSTCTITTSPISRDDTLARRSASPYACLKSAWHERWAGQLGQAVERLFQGHGCAFAALRV